MVALVASNIDVLIIGAGVSGLTTAIRLTERGYVVRIRTRESPQVTSSRAAGALWGPMAADHGLVNMWSQETLEMLTGLVDDPDSGVRMVYGLEASLSGVDPPPWLSNLPDLTVSAVADLPPGYRSGWRYTAPVVDMPVYLDYLERRVTAAGTDIHVGPVHSLHELTREAPVVVNCTGSGARDLVPDPHLVPVRGEVVVVENPGVAEFFADADENEEMTYCLPHGPQVVLGSTAHPDRSDTEHDPVLAERILRRCAAIMPRLAGATVLDHRVGFRPARSSVRVEREEIRGRHLIHNYGHGGAGVSLSWGCASTVADLVDAI